MFPLYPDTCTYVGILTDTIPIVCVIVRIQLFELHLTVTMREHYLLEWYIYFRNVHKKLYLFLFWKWLPQFVSNSEVSIHVYFYQISVEIKGRLSGHHECSDVRDKRPEIDTYKFNLEQLSLCQRSVATSQNSTEHFFRNLFCSRKE